VIFYIYALARGIEGIDGVTGISGEALVAMPQPAGVMIGGWITDRPALDRDSLARQDVVVRRVHALAPAVLPVRFGTVFSDVDSAARAIAAFGDSIGARLDLVRNREQMTLRFSGASGASSASGAARPSRASGQGTRYLERRAGQRISPEIQPFVDRLKPFLRATRVESAARTGIVTVYHLIDRGVGTEYRGAVTRAEVDLPELGIRISGPSPAYAFADLGRFR
jgi:gas vesicle protein GvpL/GvpF